MSNTKAEKANLIKTSVIYNTIEEALNRKDVIAATLKNAVERENQTNKTFTLEYVDSQIIAKEDGRFILQSIISKNFN